MGSTRPPNSLSSRSTSAGSPPTPGTADSVVDVGKGQDAPQADVEPAAKSKAKAKAKAKTKEVKPQTPLQRGEDLARQILKKKGEADELALQLGTLPFGSSVKEEVDKFRALFECSPQFSPIAHADRFPLGWFSYCSETICILNLSNRSQRGPFTPIPANWWQPVLTTRRPTSRW